MEPVEGHSNDRDAQLRLVTVWDLPTRLFHWLIVAVVVLAWVTAGGGGIVFLVHEIAGYIALAAVLFRVFWGFIGSRHSRFSDFVRPWREVRAHLGAVFRLAPPITVGHNPAGGWMVIALLVVLFAVAVTGLFAASRDLAGPLVDLIPQALARLVKEAHETLFNILVFLVFVHIAGVIVKCLLTGENLARAMWTGGKRLSPERARAERATVPNWYAVPVALLACALVWLIVV